MTFGILVDPPTKTTSLMADLANFLTYKTSSTGAMHFLKYGRHNSSNLALVRTVLKSMDSDKASISIEVWAAADKIHFAFSHWVLNLLMALALLLISIPSFFKNSRAQYSTNLLSKSSPPKWVSPEVACTSKTPSSMFKRETSKVPPPRSKMTTF